METAFQHFLGKRFPKPKGGGGGSVGPVARPTADWTKSENYLVANYQSKNMPNPSMCQIAGTAIKADQCSANKVVFDSSVIVTAIEEAGYTIESGEKFTVDMVAYIGTKSTDAVSFTAVGM